MANQIATSNLGWQNKFSTTLSSGITASDTTIPLTALPTPSEGFLVIEPDSSTAWEVIYYTSKTGSAVVCTSAANGRGVDDSTAQSHSSGATVRMDTTAGMFEVLQNMTAVTPGSAGGIAFASGWTLIPSTTPNTVVANGNRSYTCTFNGTDLTSTLSPGMRLRTTRTVAAPTQCTSLNGTTQYYSKTTPAGMTFTDSFTYSAWVKPTSYALGTIIGRFSTTGSMLQMNASGQLLISAKDAGTTDSALTYQSLPLNKWSHVAMTMVVATNTVTAYIDGVAVPTAYTNGTTTAVTQAGNLEIGGNNGGTNPFPGKIAQAAVYNAVISGATILAAQAQGLAGTETSLISAYSFNNSINDLNANANNLTANGSALATNADSPYGGQADGTISSTLDYGIITKTAFSTNTTLTVQVPEGCTIPTSGGVSAVSYATVAVPYGFPKQEEKWTIGWYLKVLALFAAGNTNNTYQSGPANGNFALSVPIGEWRGGYDINQYADQGASVTIELYSTLSTSNSSSSDDYWTTAAKIPIASGTAYHGRQARREGPLSLSAMTPYYLVAKAAGGAGVIGNHSLNQLSGSTSNIIFRCAYL